MPETYRFLIMTTDPVHIGTGGMMLGRVDNTIVREPGTKLPKIPATALHGAIRAYAARRYGKLRCAGQGQTEHSNHCGLQKCPICYTFGYSKGGKDSFSGIVSIMDARILLFPVYSMVGPVWVTSVEVLRDAGFSNNTSVEENRAKWSGLTDGDFINLGWLMLKKEENWTPQDDLKNKLPEPVKDRIVLVSSNLLSQIVNSNLEVRTSVAINPETGAAEEGALFTYEAIPRATFLWFDVVVDDFRNAFPSKKIWEELYEEVKKISLPAEITENEIEVESVLKKLGYINKRPIKNKDESEAEFAKRKDEYWEKVQRSYEALKNVMKSLNWNAPINIVNFGLEWAEHLGIGGMGTRGFGRIKNIDCWRVKEDVGGKR
ncbi:hypothetical protein JCM12298_31530 [Desulfothermus naphthae]